MTNPNRAVDLERHVPDGQRVRRIDLEHLARYRLACRFVRPEPTLDLGCGGGYGTAMLAAAGAAPCLGLERSATALVTARRDYAVGRGGYLCGDAAALPFADQTFGLVVCLETVEHVADPDGLLREIRRVLRAGGTLVLSTPNRLKRPERSIFHVREYSHAEFVALTEQHFPGSVVWLQRSLGVSLIGAPEELDAGSPDEAEGFVAVWPGAAARPAGAVATTSLEELEQDFQAILDHATGQLEAVSADRDNYRGRAEEADELEAENARFGTPRQLAERVAHLEAELHQVLSSLSWRALRLLRIAKK